jgi:O-glycosyl hydrolase
MSRSFNQFEFPIKQTPEALGYMRAWAVHGYSDGVQSDTGLVDTATASSKPLWMTETSGDGYGTNLADWNGAMSAARCIHNYLRAGRLSLWTWWTLNSPDSSSYTMCIHMGGYPTQKWYVTKHFARYIRPGARQAASSCSNTSVDVVAFWHETNQCLSIVLLNRTTSTQTVNGVAVGGGTAPAQYEKITSTASAKCVSTVIDAGASLSLPPSSITTLVAGTYRGSGVVADHWQPDPARVVPTTLQDNALRSVYTLDGRLMLRRDATRVPAAGELTSGVYVGVTGCRGAARATLIAQ